MGRILRAIIALIVVAVIASSCSRSTPNDDHASDSAISSTTNPAISTAIYDPYANTIPAAEPVGSSVEHSIKTPDGLTRTYRIYVPSKIEPRTQVPLVLAFHGGGGNGSGFESNSGFSGLAESNNFIVVYPDGTPARASNDRQLVWNGGVCCGAAIERNIDDVEFVRLLLDELESSQPIDRNRVFATGHSNGAIFSYRLACELSERVSAIGVQSGAIGVPCAPSQPVSVFHLHGLADTNIPIDGGKGSGVSGVVFPSPRAAPAEFATIEKCSEGPADSLDPQNSDVAARTWSKCRENRVIRFVTVSGASHAWMGRDDAAPNARLLVGTPYKNFDASRAIWSFFSLQKIRS